jgi:hypothetical protein
MAFLNIKRQVPPSFTSVVGSNSSYDYPLNTMAALEARKQGGLVVYVHPLTAPLNDVMDSNLGAKEAPLTSALGAMDAIDILPYGPLPTSFGTGFSTRASASRRARERMSSPTGAASTEFQAAHVNMWTSARSSLGAAGSSVIAKVILSSPTGRSYVHRERTARWFGPCQKTACAWSLKSPATVPVDSLEIVQNGVVIASSTGARIEKEVTLEKQCVVCCACLGPAGARIWKRFLRAPIRRPCTFI